MQCLTKKVSSWKFTARNFFIIFLLSITLFFSGFKSGEKLNLYSLTGFAQGTSYAVNYYAKTLVVKEVQLDSILAKIDSSMSIYKRYSLISRFNASQKGIAIDQHFKNVVEKSLQISKKSNGAFDITVFPLVNAWGFGPIKPANLPDAEQISTILKNVGYQHLRISGNQLIKDQPGTKIDVNGIAQGYTVDVIAEFLEKNGIGSYIVELGGELRVKGKKPNNESFKLGIEAVNDSDFLPITKYIEIDEGAITTSGNYRKFSQAGDKKINHLINPKTGYYLNNDLISVTVYAKDAITADGYDNVLMNLGLKNALRFLAKRNDLKAYFVYTENGIVKDTCSSGFPTIKEFK